MLQIERSHGVHRYRMGRSLLGRAFYYTAAYRVDGMMVDSGCVGGVAELMAALDGSRVHSVVNTHSHEDHIAGNAALQRRGARVLAHPLALPVLSAPMELEPQQLYRRVFWGYPAPSVGEPLGPEVETERYRFSVIHTPGHSLDHVCLYEANEGWLFTGDAYIRGKDRALKASCDVWQIIASLERLATLDAGLLFAGSGSVYQDPPRLLSEKAAYLRERGEQVLDLHRRGWSERRIRADVFGRWEPAISHLTQGDFSGLQLVRSFIEDRP